MLKFNSSIQVSNLSFTTTSYPSGSLAIAITSVQIGQFNYVVHAEMEKSSVLAVFEPNGYASCYHPNGVVRYLIILVMTLKTSKRYNLKGF